MDVDDRPVSSIGEFSSNKFDRDASGLTPGFANLSTNSLAFNTINTPKTNINNSNKNNNNGNNNNGNNNNGVKWGSATPNVDNSSTDRMCERLRALAKAALDKRMHERAAFYADKLVTLSKGNIGDVLILAKAYHQGGDFHRGFHVIQKFGLLQGYDVDGFHRNNGNSNLIHNSNIGNDQSHNNVRISESLDACFLATQCLNGCEKFDECMKLLEQVLDLYMSPTGDEGDEIDIMGAGNSQHSSSLFRLDVSALSDSDRSLLAAMCCLRGKLCESQDNRSGSVFWLKKALKVDIYCLEALEFLTKSKLLSYAEEQSLLSEDLLFAPEDEWIRCFYTTRLCLYDKERRIAERFQDLETKSGLSDNADVIGAKAEICYYNLDSRTAYELSKKVYDYDPFNHNCLPIYICSMVDLGLKSDLFKCAHELAEAHPKSATSWFAVGCYYHLIEKNESAQRYFHKATKLDHRFAPAWIGFGNAFAAQDESDQAMNAYRTTSRLFPSSHLPLLYIGMEYLRTNNLALANRFLQGAAELCNSDPLVHNEIGVLYYRQGKYDDAIDSFKEVLRLCNGLPSQGMEHWEGTIISLGHCYRKKREFEKAIKQYKEAVSLCPKQSSSYAALAFTYHLKGDLHLAIDYYHWALGLNSDDTFSSEMLSKALKEFFDSEGQFCISSIMPDSSSLDTSQSPSHSRNNSTNMSVNIETFKLSNTNNVSSIGGERSFLETSSHMNLDDFDDYDLDVSQHAE